MPEEALPIELAFAIGVTASVVGAAIYLLFLQLLGPQIKISEDIATSVSGPTREYRIKVINRRFRSLIDIQPSLSLIYISAAPGGGATLKSLSNVPLKTAHMTEIPGFRWGKKNADYAMRFSTQRDLNALWAGANTYVRFAIMVTDNYSGIKRVFTQEYHGKHHIKDGVFETGKSMKIVK